MNSIASNNPVASIIKIKSPKIQGIHNNSILLTAKTLLKS